MWKKLGEVFEVEWTAIGFCKAEISEPHPTAAVFIFFCLLKVFFVFRILP